MGSEFLLEIMEINEELDMASTKEEIDELLDNSNERLRDSYAKLSATFEAKNYADARKIVAKMNYFHNIKEKIKEKEIELKIVR